MNKKEFVEELKKLNIEISEYQLNQLDEYYKLLITWNQKINLTSIIEEKEVYLKHFYDSLTLIKVIDLNKYETLCDIGTGAGFPGLVLKIIFPNLKVTLVDSLNKRIKFLDEVISSLNLKEIETVHMRAEEFSKINREKYDIVTARAVSSLNILLELIIPSVKVSGYFISLKGNASEEIKKCSKSLNLLKSEIIKNENFFLPYEDSNRTILLIQKKEKTLLKYPRNYKDIKKFPL